MPEFDPDELRRQVLAVLDDDADYSRIESIVVARREAGVPDDALIKALTDLMLDMRAQAREDDDDLVADVLDFLTGW
ncbi:hypothetical protein [Lentzea flava]|uniref:Uncharacterized protein n=1 Tax=Lentzea flava TaxID=103732 RepID=A0ABQ2UIA6_9PSEU|nr:hypothetical protein [Lentzea flava]MCP2199523.1 hypothetical protein [Lentzea flava]GGU37500.1 hypothetical protein GCM10010178_32230 [Lentzea flava]